MIKFSREPFSEIFTEVQGLLHDHYQELTLNKDRVKLNPDWSRYFRWEDSGEFIAITARDNDTIVGYSGWILQPHLHYLDIMVAQNDVLYLKDTYRQGMTGVKLLKFSEEEMRKAGAHKITWHVKAANDFRPILYRMGYSDEDTICGKFL